MDQGSLGRPRPSPVPGTRRRSPGRGWRLPVVRVAAVRPGAIHRPCREDAPLMHLAAHRADGYLFDITTANNALFGARSRSAATTTCERPRRVTTPVGFQNSATGLDLGFYAARSYSLMTAENRRLICFWARSATGCPGRGGRSPRLRWGRCRL